MKKEQIREEAFKLYANHGYESTSMQQIADAVGLNKASLYGHYKGKSEIFKEVLQNEFQSIEIYLLKGLKEVDSLYILIDKIFKNIIKYFSNKEKLLFWKQMVLLSATNLNNEVCDYVRSVIQTFDSKIRSVFSVSAEMSKIDSQEQKIMSLYFLILTQGFLDWFLMQDEIDDNTINLSINMFNNIIKATHSFR